MTDEYPNKRDCEHGSLRGNCNICDYEEEVKDLEHENQALTKEVLELKVYIEKLKIDARECCEFELATELEDRLDKTPKQSLANHDAAVIEEAREEVIKDKMNNWSKPYILLGEYAQQLREGKS